MTIEQIVSVPKAAEMLGGISPWTVYSWLTKGILHRVKIGSRTMVRVADLQRLISGEAQISGQSQAGGRTVIREGELAHVIEEGGKSPASCRPEHSDQRSAEGGRAEAERSMRRERMRRKVLV